MKVSLEHLRRYQTIRQTPRRRQVMVDNISKYKDLLNIGFTLLFEDTSLVVECYLKLSKIAKRATREKLQRYFADYDRVFRKSYFCIMRVLEQTSDVETLEEARRQFEDLKNAVCCDMLNLRQALQRIKSNHRMDIL